MSRKIVFAIFFLIPALGWSCPGIELEPIEVNLAVIGGEILASKEDVIGALARRYRVKKFFKDQGGTSQISGEVASSVNVRIGFSPKRPAIKSLHVYNLTKVTRQAGDSPEKGFLYYKLATLHSLQGTSIPVFRFRVFGLNAQLLVITESEDHSYSIMESNVLDLSYCARAWRYVKRSPKS